MRWLSKVYAGKYYNASDMFINLDYPSTLGIMLNLLKVHPSFNKNITYWQKKLLIIWSTPYICTTSYVSPWGIKEKYTRMFPDTGNKSITKNSIYGIFLVIFPKL